MECLKLRGFCRLYICFIKWSFQSKERKLHLYAIITHFDSISLSVHFSVLERNNSMLKHTNSLHSILELLILKFSFLIDMYYQFSYALYEAKCHQRIAEITTRYCSHSGHMISDFIVVDDNVRRRYIKRTRRSKTIDRTRSAVSERVLISIPAPPDFSNFRSVGGGTRRRAARPRVRRDASRD